MMEYYSSIKKKEILPKKGYYGIVLNHVYEAFANCKAL